ncbi:MAG: hypothetical protein ACM3UZ_04865 [Acidobacteriota bacterium]
MIPDSSNDCTEPHLFPNSPDCSNDCTKPLLFPKRPDNRPGLSHIDYRIGTYSDFREALLRNLDKNAVLSGWSYRKPDDPGIALLEGASILGDILTFYQELYANEAYLRTAQWRESIADLVQLLGYHLSPGLGGKATFAFEIKGDNNVVIPAGFKISAQLEGPEQPADFETSEEVTAYPALSRFNLYRPYSIPDINKGTKSFSIDTNVLNKMGIELSKGDRLMLVVNPDDPSTDRQIVVIEKVQKRFDRTEIYIGGNWQGGLASATIYAYKLGRSFRHFGYNGPSTTVTIDDSHNAVQKDVDFSRQLADLKSMPLDAEVDDISTGSTILIKLQLEICLLIVGQVLIIPLGEYFFYRTIERVTKASLTLGAVSGGTTLIELDSTIVFGTSNCTDIRSIEFLEVKGEKFSVQGVYEEAPSSDLTTLFYFGDLQSYESLDKRFIIFVKDGAYKEVMANTNSSSIFVDTGERLRPLQLSSSLEKFMIEDFPLIGTPTVTVYGNLVQATQGKTEKEAVLGNGDSRQVFQTFKLPKSPLTYLLSVSETPPEVPELRIYVNDRLWEKVPSFFGRGSKEEIYIVREDANGDSWVQFGDRKTGLNLPSGINNVVVGYRTGTGANGALKEGTTVQPGGKLDRLDKIKLPGVVSGGSTPESVDSARDAAPGKIISLGRLVGLEDFETETLAISGVSKVSASWDLVNNIPAVVLTVLMETGRKKEIEEVRSILNNYNKCRGAQRFPVKVNQGELKYVYIDAIFAFDPTFKEDLVRKAIKEALGVTGDSGIDGSHGLFGLSQRQFGQNEYATRIEGIIQNVKGVIWVEITTLVVLGVAVNPSDLSPPEPKPPLVQSITCDSDKVLTLYKDHLQLKAQTAKSMEVC